MSKQQDLRSQAMRVTITCMEHSKCAWSCLKAAILTHLYLQVERQEAERRVGQLQEQINQLLAEASNAAAEAATALEDAARLSTQEKTALQVCFL